MNQEKIKAMIYAVHGMMSSGSTVEEVTKVVQQLLEIKTRTPETRHQVQTQDIRKKSSPKKFKKWAPEEEELLRKNAHLPVKQLAAGLERTKNSIVARLYEHGLKPNFDRPKKQRKPRDPDGKTEVQIIREERMRQCKELYEQGMTTAQIKNKLGVSGNCVRSYLDKQGIQRRRTTNKRWTEQDEQYLLQELENGSTPTQVAEHLGRTEAAVHIRYLKLKGLMPQHGKKVRQQQARQEAKETAQEQVVRILHEEGVPNIGIKQQKKTEDKKPEFPRWD